MKLRKALVASAAAVAVSFAGTSVATAETNEPAAQVVTQDTTTNENTGEEGTGDEETTKPEEGSSDIDLDNVQGWISVIVAAIGALTAIATFVQKFVMDK